MTKKQTPVHIITLGCSKNTVDSERLMKQLQHNGIHVYHNAEVKEVTNVIINTCGFIQDAKEESIDTILAYVDAKKRGEVVNLYVMGCLSQRYMEDLKKEIPDVDAYFGTENIESIVKTLGIKYKKELLNERAISTPSHYAYLKIAEGCNRKCSFCAIPIMRGRYTSNPVENLLSEARFLAGQGVKELILIAQDLSSYGTDLGQKQILHELLLALTRIEGIEWIRLHYAYPLNFPPDVLEMMRQHDNICNYLDIPFQHISNNVLRKMRRGYTQKDTYALIHNIKEKVPGIALRTTLMVGHPGEGEKEFEELLAFVKEVQFDRLGVFTYSEEEDTYSAKYLPDTIPKETKKQRLDTIMSMQYEISKNLNINKIGNSIKVIVDSGESQCYTGRSEFDSPEVDNEVMIQTRKKLNNGDFYNVRITGADAYDLIATY